jgi:GINS complex subunit 1
LWSGAIAVIVTVTVTMSLGDLATQLVLESKRSTATDTLFKYNDSLVRDIVRELRDLERLSSLEDGDTPSPALLIHQTAIIRNKRCLLAYHSHRLDRLRDLYWSYGGALPHILSPTSSARPKLSPYEVDFLRAYNASIMQFRAEASGGDLDLMAGILVPPKDIHVLVRVLKDCGTIQTEVGSLEFRRGERFMLERKGVEHLIVQGVLEILE